MKNFLLILFCFVLMMSNQSLKAQDPQFTQFYANPLYLNPAFAGSNICPRVCINYRNQWPAISGTYVTTSVSVDKFFYRIKSGIGLLAWNDRAGEGTLNTNQFSLIYAKQFRIRRNFAINAGLQATYGQKSIEQSKLTFGDMIDERSGFVYNTNELIPHPKRAYSDFSAGILGFTKKFFFGFAAHHLTQPNEGLISSSRLPMKLTGHIGAVLPLNGDKGNLFISPNIIYQKQGKFQHLDIGFYVRKAAIVGGLWYRSFDSFIALIGIEKGIFRFGYSYDITTSKLTNATAGSHEISIQFLFKCKKPPKKYMPGICPHF